MAKRHTKEKKAQITVFLSPVEEGILTRAIHSFDSKIYRGRRLNYPQLCRIAALHLATHLDEYYPIILAANPNWIYTGEKIE